MKEKKGETRSSENIKNWIDRQDFENPNIGLVDEGGQKWFSKQNPDNDIVNRKVKNWIDQQDFENFKDEDIKTETFRINAKDLRNAPSFYEGDKMDFDEEHDDESSVLIEDIESQFIPSNLYKTKKNESYQAQSTTGKKQSALAGFSGNKKVRSDSPYPTGIADNMSSSISSSMSSSSLEDVSTISSNGSIFENFKDYDDEEGFQPIMTSSNKSLDKASQKKQKGKNTIFSKMQKRGGKVKPVGTLDDKEGWSSKKEGVNNFNPSIHAKSAKKKQALQDESMRLGFEIEHAKKTKQSGIKLAVVGGLVATVGIGALIAASFISPLFFLSFGFLAIAAVGIGINAGRKIFNGNKAIKNAKEAKNKVKQQILDLEKSKEISGSKKDFALKSDRGKPKSVAHEDTLEEELYEHDGRKKTTLPNKLEPEGNDTSAKRGRTSGNAISAGFKRFKSNLIKQITPTVSRVYQDPVLPRTRKPKRATAKVYPKNSNAKDWKFSYRKARPSGKFFQVSTKDSVIEREISKRNNVGGKIASL